MAFALALLKPQAMPVLLLALLCMGRWRTLLTCAATAAAACVAVMPFLGWDWPIRYGAFVLRVAAWPPSPALDPAAMQNWRGLFIHLLGDGAAATLLASFATALSVAVVVAVWLRARSRMTGWDGRWALTLILALLVDPHLLPHDLALALVPGWILAADAIRRGARAWLVWLGVGWLLGLVAGVARDVPFTPAVLWLVATAAVLGWADLRGAPAGQPAPAPAAPGRPGPP